MGCDCCGDDDASTDRDAGDPGTDRDASTPSAGQQRLGVTRSREPIRDRALPAEIVDALARFHDPETVPETYGAWVDALHAEVTGADWFPPTVDDLCTTDASRHRAVVDGEQFHFICVLDALILAVLRDSTVSIRSTDPTDDALITAAVSPDDVAVDPQTAVVSFGIAPDHDVDGDPAPADHYATLCPYVHAFADQDAYETWAAQTDAPTDHFPFADGLALARAIADVDGS